MDQGRKGHWRNERGREGGRGREGRGGMGGRKKWRKRKRVLSNGLEQRIANVTHLVDLARQQTQSDNGEKKLISGNKNRKKEERIRSKKRRT